MQVEQGQDGTTPTSLYSNPEPEPSPVPGKTNPFSCNVCKRNYSRVDHLARHYRSHTREKPFACSTCGKAFARADLLKRHSASHSDRRDSKRHQVSTPQLARVAQACVACASAKLKCGHEKPCHRCTQKGIECTFPPLVEKIKVFTQKPSPSQTKSMVDLDTLEGAATLSSMDGQRRPIQFQDGSYSHQTEPTSLPPVLNMSSNFPRNFEGKALDSMPQVPLNPPSTVSMNNPMMELDDSSLADFLRDIMMPASPNTLAGPSLGSLDFLQQQDFYAGRDVFNFGMESSLDFNDVDFGWISSQNASQPAWNFGTIPEHEPQRPARQAQTPDVCSGMTASAEAFQNSVWRWRPQQQENSTAEQVNLALPFNDLQTITPRNGTPDPLDRRMDQDSRDKMLAMLLDGCEPANVSRVVATFPAADVLDSLMHSFFRSEQGRTGSFVHLPTFQPQKNRPLLNGIVVAAGAVLSPVPTVRKLGYAIQEAVRRAIPLTCHADYCIVRTLELNQAFALELSVGMWSGNKRKMELTEANSQPLITMLRRAGRYRRKNPTPIPSLDDDARTLDLKWRAWIEAESFKRLAFHTLIHDAQASISLLTRPLVSYAEMTLDLPYPQSMWHARTAAAWRDAYLRKLPNISNKLPSLMHCIHDLQPVSDVQDCIDLQYSTLIILHGVWSLISEYRQMDFVHSFHTSERKNNAHAVWHGELCNILDHFNIMTPRFVGGISQEARILHELFSMNLNVSLEELQLFAGKEGAEEAQRVYPLLRRWFDSRRSRQAIFHAGQLLRAADSFPSNHLRDFYAVALYHSSLCFWVYGMCSLGSSHSIQMANHHMSGKFDEPIWLDAGETPATKSFVALSRGIPMIRSSSRHRGEGGVCRVDNPKAVMETIIDIMVKNCSLGNNVVPALVENLGQLMRDLGNAAWIVSSQSSRGGLSGAN